MIKMNNLDSWRAFPGHVKVHKFVYGRGGGGGGGGGGFAPGPTGGLGGPLDPRPNLLFAKMTLLFHFIMPLDPLPGLCPGPTGGLGGPLDPQPNLLFAKMTLLFHFIMKTLCIWST